MSGNILPVKGRKQTGKIFTEAFRKRLKSTRWPLAAVLCILIASFFTAGVFERTDLLLYDTCFRVRGIEDPGNDIVVIGIDDKSIRKIGPFPWKRDIHAKLIEKLKFAKTVGIDLLFDFPSDPDEDRKLAKALSENERTVLVSQFSFEKSGNGEMEQLFRGPTDMFMQAAAGLGYGNISTDVDDVVRRVSIIDLNTWNMPFPNFGLAVALKASGTDQGSLKIINGKLFSGRPLVSVDQSNTAMPNFWGPQGTFKTYSYVDAMQLPSDTFRDKIVLVGVTDQAFHDYYSTPFSSSNFVLKGNLPTNGVEIHANVVKSFQNNRWYRNAPVMFNILFIFFAGLITALVMARRGPWAGLAIVAGVLGLITLTVYGLWYYYRLWLAPSAPVLLVFINYIVLTSADFIQAELGRRQTRAVLRRYVSPDVAEQLMSRPENIALGGNRQEVTVMFCDIRGFTEYSENKDPEQVVYRLNQYLSVMSKVIFTFGGTLDKYLGDGLMAVFGAPVNYPDHVQRAVRAAMEMKKEVERLNMKWVSQREAPLKIGIGINSGSVLVGNVGSPERMDYTVIGENVNLASRLESLTKTYNETIIVSERSVRMIGGQEINQYSFRHLGQAQVKGFSLPIDVYTVMEGCEHESI